MAIVLAPSLMPMRQLPLSVGGEFCYNNVLPSNGIHARANRCGQGGVVRVVIRYIFKRKKTDATALIVAVQL